MKKQFLSVLTLLAVVFTVTLVSCGGDDPDPIPVEDGFYIIGDGTFVTDYDAKGLMATAKNEEGQVDRPSMKEIYIAVEAGADGFQVANVVAGEATLWGPGADFADVTQGTNDEPKVTFQRGSYAVNATKFMVPADGVYHVVIDTVLGVAAVVPVHWGVIGGATINGWGSSTALTESAFDLEMMTWADNIQLTGGDWKFRYSEGWKVELDTNAGSIVRFNTNLGGAVAALEAGGANIVNADPGMYDVEIKWELGVGHTASLTKTGGLPNTNWTGVVCDAVGDGVSADNPNAIVPDPSGWAWGNKLLADNAGVPTVAGEVYTWTWTDIILEATSGFKLRTEDGVTPPTGGLNFDAGYSALDVTASSANVVDDGGNLTVTTKMAYDITLVIDAANSDTKTITIVE